MQALTLGARRSRRNVLVVKVTIEGIRIPYTTQKNPAIAFPLISAVGPFRSKMKFSLLSVKNNINLALLLSLHKSNR